MRLSKNTLPLFAIIGLGVGVGFSALFGQGVQWLSFSWFQSGEWRCVEDEWVRQGWLAGSPPAEGCPQQPPTPQIQVTPVQGVVQSFYAWYLLQEGGVAERAYAGRPELSPTLVEQLSSKQDFQADPFWLAQDVPSSFSITREQESEGRTYVYLTEEFQTGAKTLQIFLEQTSDGWQIEEIVEAPAL